jgi:hypothetical protein
LHFLEAQLDLVCNGLVLGADVPEQMIKQSVNEPTFEI